MKTKFLSVFVIFLLLTSFLSGCSNFTPLTSGPAVNDLITSNGGMAVQKGDYLYFINGYIDSTTLIEGDNQYGDEENSAIYRATLDENGELQYNEDGSLLNTSILIPKVVGFANGGFYIFDNYIYYATPTILKDKTGTVRFDLLDFYMAKLDGTGIKKIYATTAYTDSSKFAFYKIGQTVYLVVYDGTQIISVASVGTTIHNPVVMVDSATTVAFPKVTDYNASNNTVSAVNQYIYYTRALNSEIDGTILDLGNVLAKVQIGTSTEQVLMQDNVWSYSLGQVKNDSLYYTKSSTNSLSSKNYYRSLLESSFATAPETQLTGTYYDTVSVLDFENGNNRGVVVSDGSKLIYVSDVMSESGIEVLVNEKATILFAQGDYVYYTHGDNNRLARVNVKTKVMEELSSEDDTLKVDANLKVDYDGKYVYVFKEFKNSTRSSYYLVRVKYMTTGDFTTDFVGVLETQDLPDESEE